MVSTETQDGIETVRFTTDRINALNSDEIRKSILRLFELPHAKIILDLTGVSYFDSTGFSMLLYLLRSARTNYCTIRLCSLSDPVMNLFTSLRLDTTFDIYPDQQACLSSYRRGGPA